jgi:nucleoside-diphosphate-sugar epimerase
MMKIFVAGATGVLGRSLVRQLVERGHRVLGLVRNEKGDRFLRAAGGECRTADLFDGESLARAAEGAEVLVHAATAIPTKRNPAAADWAMNDRIRREGTRALCGAAVRVGARALVLQSIVWVARPPDESPFDETSPAHPDPVAQSAFDAETIAREEGERYGFRTSVLRCGYFYGSGAAHTRMMGEEIAARRMPVIGPGDAVWANLHIDDAAAAFVTAAESPRAGLWHIVDDQPISVGEMLREWAAQLGAPKPRRVPVWLARWIVGALTVEFFTRSTRTSNARFRADFGWAPRFPSFRDGLRQVTEAWKEEGFPAAAKFDAAA